MYFSFTTTPEKYMQKIAENNKYKNQLNIKVTMCRNQIHLPRPLVLRKL